jgi:glutaredoxin 3
MNKVRMYSTGNCPYCVAAERLLVTRGLHHITKLRVDTDPLLLDEMIETTRRRTVPQIYIGDTYVGGYTDLVALDREGRLRELIVCESSRLAS